MAQERKTRKSSRLEKKKHPSQPVVSFVPSKRAHLAQKSLPNFVAPPLPTPSIEDILYCGPEPDFEAIYFSLYDKLAWDCHAAEKSGRVDSAALKEKAKLILRAIENTTQLTNNTNIRNLFNHLAQLISDYFIHPTKIKLKHLKRFLSQKTKLDKDIMEEDGYLSPAPDEELLPLILAFEKLSVHYDEPLHPTPLPYESTPLEPLFEELGEFAVFPQKDPSSPTNPELKKSGATSDKQENMDPILEELGELEYFDDAEIPIEDYRPDPVAPQLIVSNSSWAKIMTVIQKEEKTTLKRPESPSSDETLSPTASHYELTRVHELGLRKKSRVDYYEEPDTQKVSRSVK